MEYVWVLNGDIILRYSMLFFSFKNSCYELLETFMQNEKYLQQNNGLLCSYLK